MSRGAPSPARRLAAAALAAVAGAGLAGCGAGVLQVGSRSVSACYRAIPSAVVASGDPHARLVGVHRLPVDVARSLVVAAPRRSTPTATTVGQPEMDMTVCAVALQGRFTPGEVEGAPVGRSGGFAVVFVNIRSLRVVGAYVLDHEPHRLLGRVF